MKYVFLLFWFSLIGVTGTIESGGDPYAAQFLKMARQLAIFINANPYKVSLTFSAMSFDSRVTLIEESFKEEKDQVHLVEFTDEILFDKDQVEKPALFNPQTGKIRVNRNKWRDFSTEDRFTLIVMEISGLIGADSRYDTAQKIVSGHGAVLAAIPTEKPEFTGPGRVIVGEKPEQFLAISEEDVLIDGGVLGTGDSLNEKSVAFLRDLSSQPEWYKLIRKAWNQDRPAYFLVQGTQGRTASITSIYLIDEGKSAVSDSGERIYSIHAYSLMFERIQADFGTPCKGEAEGMGALERLKNCYLNENSYYSVNTLATGSFSAKNAKAITEANIKSALKETGKKFYDNFLFSFAYNENVIKDMLRNSFMLDVSNSVPGFQDLMMLTQMKATGMTPSLMGPFDMDTPFWIKNKSGDPKSLRLYLAVKTLQDQKLIYLNRNIQCEGISNSIVDRDLYLKAREDGKCDNYLMGISLTPDLYLEMKKLGYYYDPKIPAWKKD